MALFNGSDIDKVVPKIWTAQKANRVLCNCGLTGREAEAAVEGRGEIRERLRKKVADDIIK